ncbi:Mu transposase C-terminal domain-containing protein [Heyndrickxia sp. NPDC080065]|uniref:Mu transposase C-terminal domain-containing protein n=1 Tax=Heyndrickxia sp. NPDC080065 TaxID=3390568 RepID=UPI003D03E9BE
MVLERPWGNATISRVGIKFKNLLYSSKQAIEEQWYLKLKNRSIEIVYDPRNVEKIYIPHDNGVDFESCILLEPSQQYRNDFLEEIIFQQQSKFDWALTKPITFTARVKQGNNSRTVLQIVNVKNKHIPYENISISHPEI